MSGRIRMGIVGVGRIGALHARLLAEQADVDLVSISDTDGARAKSVAETLGVKHVSTEASETMAQGLDALAITSSTDTHAALICQAAAAGLHVFCEKPIDLTLPLIQKARHAVAEAGVKLQIGFNRRFDSDFGQVRQKIREGQVGQIHVVRLTSRDPCPPPVSYIKTSGGLFLDMMIHDFDMARFLVGDEVEELYATGAALVDPEIGLAGDLDTAMVTMRFRNGAMCTIDNSRRAVYGYDQRAEVLGDKGCALTSSEHLNAGHFWDETAEKRDLRPDFFIRRYMAAYRTQLTAFAHCIQNDATPKATGLDGQRALELGLAAKASLAANQPITVRYA